MEEYLNILWSAYGNFTAIPYGSNLLLCEAVCMYVYVYSLDMDIQKIYNYNENNYKFD